MKACTPACQWLLKTIPWSAADKYQPALQLSHTKWLFLHVVSPEGTKNCVDFFCFCLSKNHFKIKVSGGHRLGKLKSAKNIRIFTGKLNITIAQGVQSNFWRNLAVNAFVVYWI